MSTRPAPADPPDPLGPEWATAADGTRTRCAARVVVLDGAGRVLLLRGSDPTVPGSRWWFTPGGGIAAGEDARAAALRELVEETGIAVQPADLVGPVLHREAEFGWLGQRCRQQELLFLLPLAAAPALDRSGWTALERATLDELRWWSAAELAASGETVHPAGLAGLLDDLRGGWDGVLRSLR